MSDAKYVCNRCVQDQGLSAFILDEGEQHACSYCSAAPPRSALRTLSVSVLAEHIYEKILSEYSDVDVQMVSYDNEEGLYYCDTYTSYELLTDQVGLEADEEVIDDIAVALPDLTWCKKRFDPTDLTKALGSRWEEFVEDVKHHTRYVFDAPTSAVSDDDPRFPRGAFGVPLSVDEVVSPALILRALALIVQQSQLVRTIDAGTVFFRARVHNAGQRPSTAAELGPPPREKASLSNRMSPAGIVMFYAALDRDTAIRETFQPELEVAADKVVSVAQFQCQKPLAVLDLTNLPLPPSFFVDRELRHGIRFLREFEEDLVKPVKRDGMEHVEYVPTQIVTEYFRHHIHLEAGTWLEGINYRSSKTGKPACVLFFDGSACGAETGFSMKEPVLQLQESATERINGAHLIEAS